MSIDPADNGRVLRDRVVAEVIEAFPEVTVELNDLNVPGVAAYFRTPQPDGMNIELLAWASWSYTLFAGKTTVVEEMAMNESQDQRVARIVDQIRDLAANGIPDPGKWARLLSGKQGEKPWIGEGQ